jgi:hypothetical protein
MVSYSWPMIWRLIAVLVVLGVLASAPASSQAASFRAHLSAPTHTPRAGKVWRITVSARTNSGRPLRATAFYQFLYGGRVVSTQYPDPGHPPGRRHSPYSFFGSYSDPIRWPRRAVGYRLTFRVVVRVRGRGTRYLSYWVRVRR